MTDKIIIEDSTKGTTFYNTTSLIKAIESLDSYIPSDISNQTVFKNRIKTVLKQVNENISVQFEDIIQFYIEVGMLIERCGNLISAENVIRIMRDIMLHKGDIIYFTDFFMILICKEENKIMIL